MTMDIITEVDLFRKAGDVKRWHTQRTLRPQTVGQHTFHMLTLLRCVAPGARQEVIWACIHHDLPEVMTGDVPGPIKRDHVELNLLMEEIEQGCAPLYQDFRLTVEEERLVFWLDKMELVLWSLEEVQFGNQHLKTAIRNGLSWVAEQYPPTPKAQELYENCLRRAIEAGVLGLNGLLTAVIAANGEPT